MSKWQDLEHLQPEEKAELAEALGQLERMRIANPLFFYNHPDFSPKGIHYRQLWYHSLHTGIKGFMGGNQSGKTTAGLVDDLIQAVDEDILPEHLKIYKKWEPPFYCRILTTIASVLEMVIYEKIKEFVPPSQLHGGSWEKAYDKQLRVLRFANGSWFHFMTFEQDVGAMGGATLHRVHYDEEPPWSVRKENRIRLVKHDGDECLTMTPLHGLSWAYDEIWEKRGEEERDNFFLNPDLNQGLVVVDMDENPYLTATAKANVLQGLSSEEIQSRKEGKFVHFAGLIYPDFKTQEHIIRQFDLHDKLSTMNVVVSIDPGIRNRAAVLWGALTPADELFIFEELYAEGWTIARVCDQIHKFNTMHQVSPIYYVIDPAARNTAQQTGRSDQMEYADHGVVTIAGQRAVEAGINRVKERLQNNRIFIFDNCKHLIEEFKKYRWKAQSRTGEDGRPVPVKADDHLMDALRYMVMSRPYLPEEKREREETPLQRLMREDQERFNKPSVAAGPYGGGMYL